MARLRRFPSPLVLAGLFPRNVRTVFAAQLEDKRQPGGRLISAAAVLDGGTFARLHLLLIPICLLETGSGPAVHRRQNQPRSRQRRPGAPCILP
jgi:hypothetical protein